MFEDNYSHFNVDNFFIEFKDKMFVTFLNETFFELEMKTYWKGYNTLFEKGCRNLI